MFTNRASHSTAVAVDLHTTTGVDPLGIQVGRYLEVPKYLTQRFRELCKHLCRYQVPTLQPST